MSADGKHVAQLSDDDFKRMARGGQPAFTPNRKQRRAVAKQNHIFAIPRDKGWGVMNQRSRNIPKRNKPEAEDTY